MNNVEKVHRKLSTLLKIEVQLKALWKRQMLLGIIYITYIYIIFYNHFRFPHFVKKRHFFWVKSAFLEQKVSGKPGSRPTGSRTALHFHQALSQEPYLITPRPSYSTFECHYIYIHTHIYVVGVIIQWYILHLSTTITTIYIYIHVSYITPTTYSCLNDEVSIVWNAVALSSRLETTTATFRHILPGLLSLLLI